MSFSADGYFHGIAMHTFLLSSMYSCHFVPSSLRVFCRYTFFVRTSSAMVSRCGFNSFVFSASSSAK